jgi:hypothetical protein
MFMPLSMERVLKRIRDIPGEPYFNRYSVLKSRLFENEYAYDYGRTASPISKP